MRRKLIALLLCGGLSACAGETRLAPVVVRDTEVVVPPIQPLSMNKVEWQVLPPGTGHADPLFALNERNYQSLNLNLVEIKRYLDEQGAVIRMLKDINTQRSAPPVPAAPKTGATP